MKEENNTEGLYYLKIDARHYFPDGKITRDVLEALRCRKYAEVLAFYLECDLDDIEKQARRLAESTTLSYSEALRKREAIEQQRQSETKSNSKMHRSEDVEAVTNDLVYTVRSMIMALPGRLAMDVVQVASANEASALIRAECYKILNELANYNYDPAVYQRRVRDREGWSDIIVAADETDD